MAKPSRPPALPAEPPKERRDSLTQTERDKGYGESHGYGPGHAGPSGPGDAPSKQPAKVVPNDDPLEKELP